MPTNGDGDGGPDRLALSVCKLVAWLDDESSGDSCSLEGLKAHLSPIAARAREAVARHEAARTGRGTSGPTDGPIDAACG